MVCLLKKKSKFIKQTCMDIWGTFISYGKISKAANFIMVMSEQSNKRYKFYRKDFIFSLKKRINFRRKKKYTDEFLFPRLLYNFYIVISRRNFMRYAKRAKRHSGYFHENFFGLIEGRLYMMAYRCNYITNLFLIQHVIRFGMFVVNDKQRKHYNYIMNPGDFLFFFDNEWLEFFRKDLLIRLVNNVPLWPVPLYIYINNIFMFAIYLQKPEEEDIAYPVDAIDIQLANDYYYV